MEDVIRVCFMCHQEKPLSEFYNDKTYKYGKGYRCKQCSRALNRKRDKQPHRVEKSKSWLASDRGKQLANKRLKEDYSKNKGKYLAQRAVRRLIKMGIIVRGMCEVCGQPEGAGHHPDYSEPLEVVWLCQAHHSEAHRK